MRFNNLFAMLRAVAQAANAGSIGAAAGLGILVSLIVAAPGCLLLSALGFPVLISVLVVSPICIGIALLILMSVRRAARPLPFCFALCLLTAACAAALVSPVLISDAELAVEGFQALDFAMGFSTDVPAATLQLGADILAAAQVDLQSLKQGASSPATYAQALSADIGRLKPIAADLDANSTILSGIAALQKLLPVVVADVNNQPMAVSSDAEGDPRAALKVWIKAVKK